MICAGPDIMPISYAYIIQEVGCQIDKSDMGMDNYRQKLLHKINIEGVPPDISTCGGPKAGWSWTERRIPMLGNIGLSNFYYNF
jgi:hypothetical protein